MIPVTKSLLAVLRERGKPIGLASPKPPGLGRELGEILEMHDVEAWYFNDYKAHRRHSFIVSPKKDETDLFIAGWTSQLDKHGNINDLYIHRRMQETDLKVFLKEFASAAGRDYRITCNWNNGFVCGMLLFLPVMFVAVGVPIIATRDGWPESHSDTSMMMMLIAMSLAASVLLMSGAWLLGKFITNLYWRHDRVAKNISVLASPA